MRERTKLIVSNLLNGVPPAAVATALHLEEDVVHTEFRAAMRAVEEYQLAHCVPHFAVGSIVEARQNRIATLQIVAAIEAWDEYQRDMMIDLFRHGRGYVFTRYGKTYEEVSAVLDRTLDALPHFLAPAEIVAYTRDRLAFVTQRKTRVIDAIERFTSLTNPLRYKTIVHEGITQTNYEAAANGSLLH